MRGTAGVEDGDVGKNLFEVRLHGRPARQRSTSGPRPPVSDAGKPLPCRSCIAAYRWLIGFVDEFAERPVLLPSKEVEQHRLDLLLRQPLVPVRHIGLARPHLLHRVPADAVATAESAVSTPNAKTSSRPPRTSRTALDTSRACPMVSSGPAISSATLITLAVTFSSSAAAAHAALNGRACRGMALYCSATVPSKLTSVGWPMKQASWAVI